MFLYDFFLILLGVYLGQEYPGLPSVKNFVLLYVGKSFHHDAASHRDAASTALQREPAAEAEAEPEPEPEEEEWRWWK